MAARNLTTDDLVRIFQLPPAASLALGSEMIVYDPNDGLDKRIDPNVLVQGLIYDRIDFNPQTPAQQPHLIGRIFYDSTQNTHTLYNDISGISLQLGEELRARLVNDTGGTLLDGKAVSVTGSVGASLQVELLDTSNLDSSVRGFGLMTIDTVDGEPGYAVRYGAVQGLNTSMFLQDDIVYGDPDAPGELINVRPSAPNYPVRIGVVIFSDAVNGVIGVDTLAFNGTDTLVNLEGTLDGMVTQTPNVEYSVSGGIIYADVTNEQEPTKNLPFTISGVRYLLDTTTNTGPGGSARIIVPPGASDILKQKSWLYVIPNSGTPLLGISTSKPNVVHAGIATQTAYNDVRTLTDGKVFSYRRENNASSSDTEGLPGAYGLTRVVVDDARSRGSAWDSGQSGTPTVDDLNILLALTAGVGKQLHYSNTPLFTGNLYQIYNDSINAITYADETNLINIVLDSNGGTLLGNGFYYTLRVYYKLNSNGIGNDVIVTRPSGHYSSGDLAISDALGYTTDLADTDIEDIVYPLYNLVIAKTGGGGATTTLYQLVDKRSKVPGVAGGGGGGGEAPGTDDKIRISAADTTNDYLNPKVTATEGLVKEIQNPGANEVLNISGKNLPFNSWQYDGISTTSSTTPTGVFRTNNVISTGSSTAIYFNVTNFGSTKDLEAWLIKLKEGAVITASNRDDITEFITATLTADATLDTDVVTIPITINSFADFTDTAVFGFDFLNTGGGEIDVELNDTSTNAVENRAIYEGFIGSANQPTSTTLTFDKVGGIKFYDPLNLSVEGDVNLAIAGSGNILASQIWHKIEADGVSRIFLFGVGWDSDAIHGFKSGDVLESGTYWAYYVYGPGGAHLNIDQFVDSGIDTTPPRIVGYSLAGGNVYVDVSFSEGIYGANDGSTPAALADFAITNFVPSGVTAISISSVTKTDNNALVGGETVVRCNLSLTGTTDGLETFEVQPTDGASLYDLSGNAMEATETTGTITLQLAWNPAALGSDLITGLNAGDIDGDQTDNSAYSNDDAIVDVFDIGVNSNDVSQATAADRALYKTDQENMLFDGLDPGDEYDFSSPITIDTNAGYLAIGVFPENNNNQRVWTNGTGGLIFSSGGNQIFINIGGLQSWTITTAKDKALYEFIFNAKDVELFKNGVSEGSLTLTPDSFQIATIQGRGGSDNNDGRWMTMQAVNRLLTPTELGLMRDYINSYHTFF